MILRNPKDPRKRDNKSPINEHLPAKKLSADPNYPQLNNNDPDTSAPILSNDSPDLVKPVLHFPPDKDLDEIFS